MKLIIASNRLPVSAVQRNREWHFKKSSGGLVTALASLQATHDFHWVGWPGNEIARKDQKKVADRLQTEHRCSAVFLTKSEIESFYNGFCNEVIWPLFHYLPSLIRFRESDWVSYQEVNDKFAEAILQIAAPEDMVWIHDYHLMLLPALLKKRQPQLKIGFFLHIPFPSSEVYRLLVPRQQIIEGLLGSDLIGFHCYDYARHFASACLRLLGVESQPGLLELGSRKVRLGVFPIGVDCDRFQTTLASEDCRREIKRLQKTLGDKRILLGIDRMDYTKGITLKLQAFERFLEQNPSLRTRVLLYQVAIPSRLGVSTYQQLTNEVDRLIGRINGQYGSLGRSPVYYLNREVSFTHLCALYAISDVALLSPIRDGMNLVALEYILCSLEKKGVLVLSEFAGAAHSLPGCLMVNPWDTHQVADAIKQAITMTPDEKQRRFEPMYQFVRGNTAARWGERFISDLLRYRRPTAHPTACTPLQDVRSDLIAAYRRAKERLFFFDYDGTLTSFRATPMEAIPDATLLQHLDTLAKNPCNRVSLVSGRDRRELAKWFGHLPIHLCAEHGLVYRPAGEGEWQAIQEISLEWKDEVRKILEYFQERTPGTLIEEKPSSLAWHYRRSDPIFGQWQADELLIHLEEILARAPVDAIRGHRVIEIRPQGIHKGRYVQALLQKYPAADFIFCVGDDRTDEDMYASLPPPAWTCRVGKGKTVARTCVENPAEVLDLLASLTGS